MTTIAYDGKTVAADGQKTWRGERLDMSARKLRVCAGAIYAFTGLAALKDAMIEWHINGADPSHLPPYHNEDAGGWTLIVVTAQGLSHYTEKVPYPEFFPAPMAYGADMDLARGAMLAGKSAEEAIRIAASVSIFTGGEIQVIDIAEALGLNSVKEAAE